MATSKVGRLRLSALPVSLIVTGAVLLASGGVASAGPVAAKSCARISTEWGMAAVTVRSRSLSCQVARRVARGYFLHADRGVRFDFFSSAGGGWKVRGWKCRPAERGSIGECARLGRSFYTQRTPPPCSPRVPRSVACRPGGSLG